MGLSRGVTLARRREPCPRVSHWAGWGCCPQAVVVFPKPRERPGPPREPHLPTTTPPPEAPPPTSAACTSGRRSRPSEDCVLNCPGGRTPPPSPPAYPQCGSLSRQCGATAPRGLLAIPAWTPSPPASSRDEVRRVSGFGGRADWGTNGGRQRCQWRRGRAMG